MKQKKKKWFLLQLKKFFEVPEKEVHKPISKRALFISLFYIFSPYMLLHNRMAVVDSILNMFCLLSILLTFLLIENRGFLTSSSYTHPSYILAQNPEFQLIKSFSYPKHSIDVYARTTQDQEK